MKFQYSPGLFGYGPKGIDGSDGLSGAAMYFTDYDPVADLLIIESAIENDEVLLSQVPPGTKLPGGRTYNTGDLIVVINGDIYEIDASENEYSQTDGKISKADYFDQYYVVLTDNGYQRYSNIYDGSTNYIIDNVVLSNPGTNYTSYPSRIYNIETKNFARIEYIDQEINSYFPFSVYSSGENTVTDDYKSIGILKSDSDSLFRIGNLDANGNLRNVNLILDVSSLIYKKETSNLINIDATTGIVLTNKEISTNILFDPAFTESPTSFTSTPGNTQIQINWDLTGFTSDTSIIGTLFFFQKQDPSGTYRLDASIVRPLMLHDLDSSGSVIFNELPTGATFQYYIVIDKDGWERSSVIKNITTSATPPELDVNDPATQTLSADSSGWFSAASSYTYTVDISTDSFSGWNVTSPPPENWITLTPTSGPMGNDTFDVSLSRKDTTGSRQGTITIGSEADDKTITVTQTGTPVQVYVYFDEDGSIVAPEMTDEVIRVYYTINSSIYGYSAVEPGTEGRTVTTYISPSVDSIISSIGPVIGYKDQEGYYVSAEDSDSDTDTGYVDISIGGDTKSATFDLGCYYNSKSNFVISTGYVKITNVVKQSGSGDVSTGNYNAFIGETGTQCSGENLYRSNY